MAESAFPSLQSAGPTSLLITESQNSESLPSLHEKDPDFVNASDVDRFRCALHPGLLHDPQQTKCGHRFCRSCLENYIGDADTKPCPVGDADCETVSRNEMQRDNSIIRDIKKALVHCPNKAQGCSVKTRYHKLKEHLEVCDYEPVVCIFTARGCLERVPRGQLEQHQVACPSRPAQCPQCSQEVNHKDLKTHAEKDCPETVLGCPFGCGNKQLKRKEVESHKSSCPVHPVDCKFKHMGCNFSNKREEVDRHEKKDLDKHLELVTKKVADLYLTSMEQQGKIQSLTAERENLERSAQSMSQDSLPQNAVRRLEKQIKELKLNVVSSLEKAFTLERRFPELAEKTAVQNVEQSVRVLTQRVTTLEQSRTQTEATQRSSAGATPGPPAESINTVMEHVGNHQNKLDVHDIRLAEMDLRFQLLETAAYDGKLIWKIRDYQRRKRDAMDGRTLSLYSQPFYTNRFGYKMCARVYLNGDGMGKGTHLSLFFVVMRGEYDPLLLWPFRQKVTLTLLDQSPEKRHLTDNFQPDHTSSSFQRPTTEMNIASGCPLFVSHTVLESPNNAYLRDDTLFIRIVVDDSVNSSPF